MLKVSCCDQSLSVVRHSPCGINNFFKSVLFLHLGQWIRNWVESIGVTCRSNIAEIVPIDLLFVLPCIILFLCFSFLLALGLPHLGKRELILVLFVC